MNEVIDSIIVDGLQEINRLFALEQESIERQVLLTQLNDSIETLKTQLNAANVALSNASITIEQMIESEIQNLRILMAGNKEENDRLDMLKQNKILVFNNTKNELELNSSEEPVLFWNPSCLKPARACNLAHDFRIIYNLNVPIALVEKEAGNGDFSEESQSVSFYHVRYISKKGCEADAEVRLFVKKKDHPTYIKKCKIIQEKINGIQNEIEVLNTKIQAINIKLEEKNEQINSLTQTQSFAENKKALAKELAIKEQELLKEKTLNVDCKMQKEVFMKNIKDNLGLYEQIRALLLIMNEGSELSKTFFKLLNILINGDGSPVVTASMPSPALNTLSQFANFSTSSSSGDSLVSECTESLSLINRSAKHAI